jgi:hypothetical protein
MVAHRSTLVLRTRTPLIALERHDDALDVERLPTVRDELLAGRAAGADGFRSGFLLGMQAGAASHPAALALADALRERIDAAPFSLSFYKLAEGRPPAADEGPFYDGPHLDSHPQLTGSHELLRVLVNLSERPRRFAYAVTDRWELQARGVPTGREAFVPLHLPAGVATRIVEIPGREGATVHALRFLASAVPHVGHNDEPEHFLVSFETVVDLASGNPLAAG